MKTLRDKYLSALAEQENIRTIAKRDVSNSANFATTKMAKSLLDICDNLTRAMDVVPVEMRTGEDEANQTLRTLFEGIQMTDTLMLKAFAGNGLVRYCETGDVFDPNLHEALFEYPDPEKEGGTVGQVLKTGFKLNNRVIRSAQVGVVKKA
jgi:molecular chaperone GrpE